MGQSIKRASCSFAISKPDLVIRNFCKTVKCFCHICCQESGHRCPLFQVPRPNVQSVKTLSLFISSQKVPPQMLSLHCWDSQHNFSVLFKKHKMFSRNSFYQFCSKITEKITQVRKNLGRRKQRENKQRLFNILINHFVIFLQDKQYFNENILS